MPVPVRYGQFGRSQSWDAAGWYEGPWEDPGAPGRRSSLADGDGAWEEQQDWASSGTTGPPFPREVWSATAARRKNSAPDFTVLGSRRTVISSGGSLRPPERYCDMPGAGRVPPEPRQPGGARTMPGFGLLGGSLAWDQVLPDMSHLPLGPSGDDGFPQAPRTQSRSPAPARYPGAPPDSRYSAEGLPFAVPAYSSMDSSRQPAPTCLVVDAESGRALNRGFGTARDNLHGPAPYENCVAGPLNAQAPGGRNAGLPSFLALLRNEGLSEATLGTLLQQGFDCPAALAALEDADIKCVAPNLGQARVLSQLVGSFRQSRAGPLPRAHSSSPGHRSGEPQGDVAPPVSPRPMGPTRRPASAPDPAVSYTTHFSANVGYGSPAPCALTARLGPACPPQAGLALVTGPQGPRVPGTRPAYPTAYTVPMELLKRERSMAASPLASPHGSPQLLRRPGVPLEELPPAAPGLHTPHSPYQKVVRRTGAPIIVSTMLAPEPSNHS